jgi:hypothetical protein
MSDMLAELKRKASQLSNRSTVQPIQMLKKLGGSKSSGGSVKSSEAKYS